MQSTRVTGKRTRAVVRTVLADITPRAEPGAMGTSPGTASTTAPEPKELSQPWDSLCVHKDCPIKHPHNFGLRPQTSPAPVVVWQDADAVVPDDRRYPDTQPPPLIKAMIDTLRDDPMIKMRYPQFMDVLQDFYRAHGGRSDVYHWPAGMFGLGMDVSGDSGYGFYPWHKHPDEERMGGCFAFEVVEETEDPAAKGRC